MQGLAEFEHHVVGDVDQDAERADSGERQAGDHPRRSGSRRVDVAHDAGDELGGTEAASDRGTVVHDRREGVLRVRHVGPRTHTGIAEVGTGRVGVLAGDAADRERIAAVGRDVDLDRDVVEAEEALIASVPTGRVDAELHQAQDAGVLLAESELFRRGDHAVGGVTVGLARGDRERAGQHRTGQGDGDLVADEEVARAAHDAVHRRPAVRGGLAVGRDLHLAPADRLAVGLRLFDELEHFADHDGSLQLEAVDVLLLEPDAHERGEHVFGGGIRRHIDVLTQPRKRDAHQTTIPNCSLKRTSPSAMSRMSCTSLRNIRVRSIPIPNAKPEYSSGSMPARAARSG